MTEMNLNDKKSNNLNKENNKFDNNNHRCHDHSCNCNDDIDTNSKNHLSKHDHNCNCNNHDCNDHNLNDTHACDCGHHDYCEEQEYDEDDDYCDIEQDKICNNCGRCLDVFNVDEKGYVKIPIDKIDKSTATLYDLYKMYGLDED